MDFLSETQSSRCRNRSSRSAWASHGTQISN